jgi:voltage-gated potassium channel
MSDLRRRLYHELEPSHREAGLSTLNRIIVVAILVSVAFVVVESEPAIHDSHPILFHAVEIVFGLVFLVEYVARIWVAAEDPRYSDGLRGRLRYALTPSALVDLLAVTPLFLHVIGAEAYIIRILRVVRVMRLAKLGRFTVATRALSHAVHARRYELLISFGVAFFILVLASTLMYIVEGHSQPETFGSIPRAMWWAIATLTTVGYGDAVPLTLPGRILGGITAVTGVGLIAMPAGILAAAMSDAIHTRRAAEHREALEHLHRLASEKSAQASLREAAEGERDG